jgi:ribosomal protein S12 methylthiotransferase accessory factor
MRPDPHPLRDRRLNALAGALGVTRVARITGLDRTGIEVASAIRPGGHVLQVTNGKGETFEEAARGALMEAAELWAAERAAPVARGSAADIRADGVDLVAPSELLPGHTGGTDTLRLAWASAEGLLGPPFLVPAHAVSCPAPGTPLLGPAVVPWTSNGMGAHPDPEAAILHGLLEAIERDRLARALPEGFTEPEIAARMIDPRTLAAAAPRTAALVERLRGRGFRVYLFDCTTSPSARDLALPVAAAVLVDRDGGPVPVAAGYACRLSRDEALRAALLEAAQSRATEIHGAREDVLAGDRDAAAPLADLCERARPTRPVRALPDVRADGPAASLRAVLVRLGRAGLERAGFVAFPPVEEVHVMKVVVPGFLVSELL